MSRIGKAPIEIPQGVTAEVAGNEVSIAGPKGNMSFKFEKDVLVKKEENTINVEMVGRGKGAPAMWGMTRAMIANMVKGVTEGFEKKLELVGVGYRAKQVSSNEISLTVGFSHPVDFKSPEGVNLRVEDNTHIIVSGFDKHLVGLTASKLRMIRKPEPYKGKGIKYENEVIRRKAGKAGKVGSGAA